MDYGFLFALILATVIHIIVILKAYACRGGSFDSVIASSTNMDYGFLFALILATVIDIIVILKAYACRGGSFDSALARENAIRSALPSLAESNNTTLTKHKVKPKVANDQKTAIDSKHLTVSDNLKRSKPSLTSVDDGNGNKSTVPRSGRRPAKKQSEHSTRRTSDSVQNCRQAGHGATKTRKAGRYED
jgi:hypothetical protein